MLNLLITLSILSLPAYSQTESTKEPVEHNALFGSWGGLKDKLADAGYAFEISYTPEFHKVISGGLQQKSEFLGNINFISDFEGEKLLGMKGTTAQIYIIANHGGSPSQNVGDVQWSSNIETPEQGVRLYSFWLQQTLFDEKVSILLGTNDLNSEFYLTDSASLFLHSSFGMGAELASSGVNGPSTFPYTAPTIRLKVEPTPAFYLQTAAFNGVAGDPSKESGTRFRLNLNDGQLFVTEAGYLYDKEGKTPGKYAIGTWSYSKTFSHQVDNTQSNSNGAYILADQKLNEVVSVFAHYGVASPESNRFASCLTAGTVLYGLIPHRENDALGLGVALAKTGNEYNATVDTNSVTIGSETAWELTYNAQLFAGVSFQSSFQKIMNPDNNSQIDDAALVQARLNISL